jgi:hypothetical protein
VVFFSSTTNHSLSLLSLSLSHPTIASNDKDDKRKVEEEAKSSVATMKRLRLADDDDGDDDSSGKLEEIEVKEIEEEDVIARF